jgi:HEAT repeat protein
MSEEPGPVSRALALRLGDHDHAVARAAERSLEGAGRAGLDAVLWGLSHPDARVRRGCAGYLDHHGTDACFPRIRWLALHDPAAKVRYEAVHAATCQRCKPAPLTGDLVGLLVRVALDDPSVTVRLQAIAGLRSQSPDARAAGALAHIVRTETDGRLRGQAHHALKHLDPAYKARFDAEARQRGIAAARGGKQPPGAMRRGR